MKFGSSFSVLFALCLLSACGSDSSPVATGTQATAAGASTGVADSGPVRPGVSTDYNVPSDLDGAAIAFTVHEPDRFQEGVTYPLVLHSHGYGGSRISASQRGGNNEVFNRLLAEGYGVISIDERGFGESGGKVRILDPYFEGQDLLQTVDWAEANLDWLQYRENNLVLGAMGGSYGGGYQHLIHAIDPQSRLDAIVPEITWNDLRFSLFPNGVFKSYWAILLSAVGNLGQATGGGQDQIVNQGLTTGLLTNTLDQEALDLLYQNSLASYCAGENPYVADKLNGRALAPVSTMYWQGAADSLFNLTEALRNARCMKALGADVRLLTKNQGHDSAGVGGEQCGELKKTQAIVDWFDEKLKGNEGQANYIPQVCYHLDGSETDGVVLPALPVNNQSFEIPELTLLAQELNIQPNSVPLVTAGPDGLVVAGAPEVTVSLSDPTGLNQGDPIVFFTLAKRMAGTSQDVELLPNMAIPLRGFTEQASTELAGFSARLMQGDELRLLIYTAYPQRYVTSGSLLPTPVVIAGKVDVPVYSGKLPKPPAN